MHDLGIPADVAGFVSNHGQHNPGQEAAAILAKMPSLILSTAISTGSLQLTERLSPRHIFRYKQTLGGEAHNLPIRVSQQPFGAPIPTHDPPGGIHLKERIILDALHEQTEALFAF